MESNVSTRTNGTIEQNPYSNHICLKDTNWYKVNKKRRKTAELDFETMRGWFAYNVYLKEVWIFIWIKFFIYDDEPTAKNPFDLRYQYAHIHHVRGFCLLFPNIDNIISFL